MIALFQQSHTVTDEIQTDILPPINMVNMMLNLVQLVQCVFEVKVMIELWFDLTWFSKKHVNWDK